MKKGCWLFAAAFLIVLPVVLTGVNPALAGVYVNGRPWIAHDQLIEEEGRILVPVQPLCDALGAELEWDEAIQTATISSGYIRLDLTVDSPTAVLNQRDVELDAAPRIVNQQFMAPLRFLAESLGYEVTYYEDGDWVTINGNKGLSRGSDEKTAELILFDREAESQPYYPEYIEGTWFVPLSSLQGSLFDCMEYIPSEFNADQPGGVRIIAKHAAGLESAALTFNSSTAEINATGYEPGEAGISYDMGAAPRVYMKLPAEGLDRAPGCSGLEVLVPVSFITEFFHCSVEYVDYKNVLFIRDPRLDIQLSDREGDFANPSQDRLDFHQGQDIYMKAASDQDLGSSSRFTVQWQYYTYPNNMETRAPNTVIVFEETISPSEKNALYARLPAEMLAIDMLPYNGNGRWQVVVKNGGRTVSHMPFMVIPAGARAFLYDFTILYRNTYGMLEGLPNGSYPMGSMNGKECVIHFSDLEQMQSDTGQGLLIDFQAICDDESSLSGSAIIIKLINGDEGRIIKEYDWTRMGASREHIPLGDAMQPGKYEYALYVDGEYQNSLFLTFTDD